MHYGSDQAQAPLEAPRDGRGDDRGPGPNRASTLGRGAQEAVPDDRARAPAEHPTDLEGAGHARGVGGGVPVRAVGGPGRRQDPARHPGDLAVFALALYIPGGYYMETWM